VHLQPYYRNLGFDRGQYPASEHYYDRAMSIPLFPALTEAQQDRVVDTLRASIMNPTEVTK
jgi:dTDP-4-amino-4,6-dideoxygalactose transaminase